MCLHIQHTHTPLCKRNLFFLMVYCFEVLSSTCFFSPPGATQPIAGVYFTALHRALASSRTRLLDHTQRRATFGRTPLNE
jgi:hypothetical protein